MPLPWLAIIDGLLSAKDVVRWVKGRTESLDAPLAAGNRLETRLAGVVVSALKEAFDRDSARLEFERQRLEEERERAERAMRMEVLRQAGEREMARLRLLAVVAIVSLLGTFVAGARFVGGPVWPRVACGIGWLLMLGGLAAAFSGQTRLGRVLAALDERTLLTDFTGSDAGTAASWLTIAGLAVFALGALLS